ncbi:DUF2690 domain-containing protein [Cellulomonas sp.]|uniref:DUF2690 domain-containing protein n=1 Tax=Cellulomonas sp. TaxID=40001 RepID=UPI001B0E1874|nr:DUF2690 domain-containing protein [Cellulomonas sp.]MBO9555292.1 DUF2690 domain-containing protein [Cellulomonas sp.]
MNLSPLARRAAARVLVVLTLLAGVVVGSAASPAAAVGCYGATCTGKDPQANGCAADAVTVEEFTYYYTRVELRKSAACHAAWTRASNPAGTPPTSCNDMWVATRGYDANDVLKGSQIQQTVCGQGSTWTAMRSYFEWVRGCVIRVWYDQPPVACTARH